MYIHTHTCIHCAVQNTKHPLSLSMLARYTLPALFNTHKHILHITQAMAFIYDKTLVQLLFEGAQERYADRNGGYTRVKREPMLRRGDATEMAIIELV